MRRLNPGGEQLAIAEGPPVRLDATGTPSYGLPTRCRPGQGTSLMEVFTAAGFSALLQVIAIDLVLAGDNAIVIGMAAAGLPKALRRKAIMVGIAAATVLRIGFALITTWLLQLGPALLLAGGLLLLWVCWKMWRELRTSREDEFHGTEALDGDHDNGHS